MNVPSLGDLKMDYEKIGMKCGIEIHQELATVHKLFCRCPPVLSDKKAEFSFVRRLRPGQSEMGEIDPAALFEFQKGKLIQYEADSETSCLVEMDEEPPSQMDLEALEIAHTFALMIQSNPIDEVHIMRKTVVDGSNTGGFQRTCVVSLGGAVEVMGNRYGINQICLEEDAARNIGEEGKVIRYRIDRLGIPLMEITTAPDMHSPKEVQIVAYRIGSILRAMGKVRRGIGSIRQDLNISILNGPIVEIKGVQALDMIPIIVENEVKRQINLIEIANELKKREVLPEKIIDNQINVSDIFSNTECKIIKNALTSGGVVMAVNFPGFSGLIGREICPGRRLGTEFSDHAKYRGNVKGLIHTDELPGYNITPEEVNALRIKLNAEKEDAIVIIADEKEKCISGLSAVVDRARESFKGIPLETRSTNVDGTTRFTRPRPGAARMYPETDVRLIEVNSQYIERVRKNLPEMPEQKLNRFMKIYNLNEKLATQIIDSEYTPLFEELSNKYKKLTTLIAVTLTEDLKKLQREGISIEKLKDENIKDIFALIYNEKTVKESIPEVLSWLSKNPEKTAIQALTSLGLEILSYEKLSLIIEEKIKTNKVLIKNMGEKASDQIMKIVMAEVRGKAKVSDVQKIIIQKIKENDP